MAETSNTTSNTVIQIRRSNVNVAPKSLANGELAYSFVSDRLFIGKTETANSPVEVTYIGGKVIVDKVANLESIVAGLMDNYAVEDNLQVDSLRFSSYTPNSILFVKDSGDVDFVSGNEGEVLQIVANGSPDFGRLDGGIY
jgi:hypothetical protein